VKTTIAPLNRLAPFGQNCVAQALPQNNFIPFRVDGLNHLKRPNQHGPMNRLQTLLLACTALVITNLMYQMSAVHAMEDALGVTVPDPIRALRRLIYCGEWIESHTLHIYMLHAPDFLGYADAIQMARDHGDIVRRGLQLKKAGNALVALLGGREIHPINVRVGGFYKVPTKRELARITEQLQLARDTALETVRWVANLPIPDFQRDYEFVALQHAHDYPFNQGRLVSTGGLAIDVQDYNAHFEEQHVQHSTALHSVLKDRGAYCVGPLARYNINFDRLSPLAQDAAREAGLSPLCRNPFQSIIVRSVEVLYACDEALRLIGTYEMPDRPAVSIEPRAATGHACTEAPRGILYHRYQIDAQGLILDAQIVPPTSQNQKTIEEDLYDYVARYLERPIELPKAELTWQCEQVVRNYDPCISCSTHFLKLHLEQED
jgi:coenzyme F420-reducing hydrogenase alpha subunit